MTESLFRRNADIIATLNYHHGVGSQLSLASSQQQKPLAESEVVDWTRRVIDYLQHYELWDYIGKLNEHDHKLLNRLPEQIPSSPDELRRLRLQARLDLLRDFTRELSQVKHSTPHGSAIQTQ